MTTLDAYPTGPGSYDHFLKSEGLSHGPESVQRHGEALYRHRLALAAFHGVTLEQLHAMKFDQEQAEAA